MSVGKNRWLSVKKGRGTRGVSGPSRCLRQSIIGRFQSGFGVQFNFLFSGPKPYSRYPHTSQSPTAPFRIRSHINHSDNPSFLLPLPWPPLFTLVPHFQISLLFLGFFCSPHDSLHMNHFPCFLNFTCNIVFYFYQNLFYFIF